MVPCLFSGRLSISHPRAMRRGRSHRVGEEARSIGPSSAQVLVKGNDISDDVCRIPIERSRGDNIVF